MKFVAVILLSFVAAAFAAPRIIGGKDAPDGKYPYMVSLRIGSRHHCGGSILNERWILTAAHCVENIGHNGLTVVAGTNLIDGGDGQEYQSEYLVFHEKWNTPAFSNDVGLVRVNKDIQFNAKVQRIELPNQDFNKAGYPLQMSGWGSTILWGPTPNKLQEITLKYLDQEACERAFTGRAEINKGHICSLTKYGEGICHGDSGSPLVADGVQVGIASFVTPCAVGDPDVYARVYTFLDWIAAQQAKF